MKTALVIALIVASGMIGFMGGRNTAASEVQAAELRLTVAEESVKTANDQCKQKLMDTIGAMSRANKPIEGYGQMNPQDWLQVLQLVKLILH